MNKDVITISREYGSGGRYIGEILAKALNIPFYDKEIIQLAAEKSGMSAGFIEKSDESIPNTFLQNLKYSSFSNFDSASYYETPVTDKVFLAQSAIIRELAAKGSCVIVGRCADYILKDNPDTVTVFIRGNAEDRIRHAVKYYGLSPEGAIERIKKIDKSRKNYYKYYTNSRWGQAEHFDLVVNSSMIGIDGAVAVIMELLKYKHMESEWGA